MVATNEARRVTMYEDVDGLWRYKAQGGNWRTLTESRVGVPRSTVLRIIRRDYPDAEVVIVRERS